MVLKMVLITMEKIIIKKKIITELTLLHFGSLFGLAFIAFIIEICHAVQRLPALKAITKLISVMHLKAFWELRFIQRLQFNTLMRQMKQYF